MEVRNALPSIGTIVGDDSIALPKNPLRSGNRDCQTEHVGREIAVVRPEVVQRCQVAAGNHQHVGWSLRFKVTKGDGELALGHKLGPEITLDDLAEEAIG